MGRGGDVLCRRHGRFFKSGECCFDCAGDAYAEAFAKDSPKETSPEFMSKSSVEALVKTMLGPIEDRLRKIEERDEITLKALGSAWTPETVRMFNLDCAKTHTAEVVGKEELERLRRIESIARRLTSMPVLVQGEEAADLMCHLGEAVRS